MSAPESEGLSSKLQLERNRREIFERRAAELEGINDSLRIENDRLISEVQELKKRLTYLEPEEEDQSDSSEDGYEDFLQTNGGNKEPKEQPPHVNGTANLTDNQNHSNANGPHSSSNSLKPQQKDIKILTLKRKQKALKAELEETLCKTMNFQEAFQNEMDLRTKLDEKYENLRVRYERLVCENDHFRTVLMNHCIDVPPPQPLTGKRKPRKQLNSSTSASLHPPSFIPPGRSPSRASNSSSSSPSHKQQALPPSPGQSTPKKSPNLSGSQHSPSLSSKSSQTSLHRELEACENDPLGLVGNDRELPHWSELDSEAASNLSSSFASASREGPVDGRRPPSNLSSSFASTSTGEGLVDGRSSSRGGSTCREEGEEEVCSSGGETDSGEEDDDSVVTGDGSVEHIVIQSPTHDIERLLMISSDQIARAREFYDLVREKAKSDLDSD